MPAARFLAELGMSDRAQAMLFEAFARSFFARPAALSAAELIAMFHYYFLGNPEGIGFDAPDTDYLTCIWAPLRAYLERHGARVRTGTPVRALARRRTGGGSRPTTDALTTRHVVLAVDPGALRDLLALPGGGGRRPSWRGRRRRAWSRRRSRSPGCGSTATSRPPAPTFSAVSREPTLDSVTVYSRLERPSRGVGGAHRRVGRRAALLRLRRARRRHGHRPHARRAARRCGPRPADARVVHRQERLEATAPTFPPGTAGTRPRVRGAAPGVRIAGDHVEPPFLCGLMERAALTGVLAANDVLAEVGAGPEAVRGVPQRGLLAGWLRRVRRSGTARFRGPEAARTVPGSCGAAPTGS